MEMTSPYQIDRLLETQQLHQNNLFLLGLASLSRPHKRLATFFLKNVLHNIINNIIIKLTINDK